MIYDEVVSSVLKIIHRLNLSAKTSQEQEVSIRSMYSLGMYLQYNSLQLQRSLSLNMQV